MKLSELVRCPVKVQRCAGRVVQTELIVQVDQRDIVPGDIIIFEPGDLFPGDVRLLTSKHLVVRYVTWNTYSIYGSGLVSSFMLSIPSSTANYRTRDFLLLEQPVLTNRGVWSNWENSWHQRRSEHSFARFKEYLFYGRYRHC